MPSCAEVRRLKIADHYKGEMIKEWLLCCRQKYIARKNPSFHFYTHKTKNVVEGCTRCVDYEVIFTSCITRQNIAFGGYRPLTIRRIRRLDRDRKD